jgi:DnaD/phage-associated family protein
VTDSGRFAGFPSRAHSTAVPNVFFSDVASQLTEPGALAVALFAFHLLGAKKGFPRYLTRADFAASQALAACLAPSGDASRALDAGLAAAVAARMLLTAQVDRAGARETLYVLNAPADRRGLETIRSAPRDLRLVDAAPAPARTSIFVLYESLIGTLGPGIAEELTEAERLYPAEWLEAAFREAAAQNARSWRYITRILERWAAEGRDHAKADTDPAAGGRYFAGKYGRILKQRMGRR